MYTGCAPPAAPAVGNNRRPLPAIGGRFGLRPVSSYTGHAMPWHGMGMAHGPCPWPCHGHAMPCPCPWPCHGHAHAAMAHGHAHVMAMAWAWQPNEIELKNAATNFPYLLGLDSTIVRLVSNSGPPNSRSIHLGLGSV